MAVLRSALIVPAGAAIEAAYASGADALILDLDGRTIPAPPAGMRLYPRIAPLDDPRSIGDLEAAVAASPSGIALPLARGGADVQRLGARLAVLEAERGLPDGSIRILAFVSETPEAIFALSSYRDASARLEAMIFTAAPLAAALRVRSGRAPLRLARELTLIAARAAGVLALDAPFADVEDLQGLRAEALAAREDGFDGKIAVDARQVRAINEIFRETG